MRPVSSVTTALVKIMDWTKSNETASSIQTRPKKNKKKPIIDNVLIWICSNAESRAVCRPGGN